MTSKEYFNAMRETTYSLYKLCSEQVLRNKEDREFSADLYIYAVRLSDYFEWLDNPDWLDPEEWSKWYKEPLTKNFIKKKFEEYRPKFEEVGLGYLFWRFDND